MARVFRTQSLGTQRTRLSKSIVISIREIHKKQEFDQEIKEIIAYIVLALNSLEEMIDVTVQPWENRGYWVKADRFRLDWDWAKIYSANLRKELNADNWDEIIPILIKIGLKLQKIQVSVNHRMGKPWVGALEEYQLQELNKDE